MSNGDSNQDSFQRVRGIKKSKFPALSEIPPNSTFDYVGNSTNYKIPVEDLLAALGVTGTLSTIGAAGAVAILRQLGSQNQIRSLTPGDGLTITINPDQGITIASGITQNDTGLPLIQDLDTAAPVVTSLVAGDGIGFQTSEDGKVIEIVATGELPETKIVTVNQESDFPTPVSGVITLEANTVYRISNDITTANRFVLQANTSVIGGSSLAPKLTYSGSDTMFTAVGAFSVLVSNLNFTAPSAKLFDVSGLVLFTFLNNVVDACDIFGDFADCTNINLVNSGIFSLATDGLRLSHSGTGNIFAVDGIFMSTAASSGFTAIDLGVATYDTIEIQDLAANAPATNIGIEVAAASANISANNLGQITNCNFTGGITAATNSPETQVRWQTLGNDDIPDSTADGLITLTGNSTETVISTVDTPVKVAGTWVDQESNLFTFDASGRLTYIGERDLRVPIDIACSFIRASGGSNPYTACIAINGVPVDETCLSMTLSSSVRDQGTLIWQHTFQTDDYVELWVESNSGTTNCICEQSVMRIN